VRDAHAVKEDAEAALAGKLAGEALQGRDSPIVKHYS
jgi:hypothetical protein